MGLFGLFASLFGLGAMGADAYKDAVNNWESQDKAYKDKELFYYRGRKKISFETGKECDVRIENGHKTLCDTRTGMLIHDYTNEENDRKTREAKYEAHKKGERFYKTYREDTVKWHIDNLYANDDMPGRYFKKVSPEFNRIPHMIGYKYVGDYYEEVKLEYYYNEYSRSTRFRYDTKFYDNTRYLPNGEVLTKEKELKLIEEQAKERAIKNGDAFYTYASMACSHPTRYEITKKVSDGSYWCYVRSVNYIKTDYYVPGILKSKEILRSGKTELETVYWTEANPNRKEEAYLLNGESTKPYLTKVERENKEAKEKAVKEGKKYYVYYEGEENNLRYRWIDTDEEVTGLDLLKCI